MKKFAQSYIAAVVLFTLTAVTALLASPSTRSQIAEQFNFGVVSVFPGTAAPDSGPVTVSSVSTSDSFHFLEPLAPNAGDPTKFDASLLNYLTVEICDSGWK